MANRKQFANIAEPNQELTRRLAETRGTVVGESDLREQRISFAFGNALGSDRITKESVRAASTSVRLFPVEG